MKKKLTLTLSALALSAFMCFGAACTGNPDPNPDPEEETYTITFMDGDTVIKTETVKKGEKVTAPAAPTNGDSRYTFVDWDGRAAGSEITVLSNVTYNAVWYEMFGSNTTFSISQRDPLTKVTVDGQADEGAWKDIQAFELDENGSTLQVLWDSDALYLFANIVQVKDPAEAVDEDEDEETVKGQLIVTLDLLHSEDRASDNWNGTDWGGPYRGEPGPMVEGGYTIDAGTADVQKSLEWLSFSGYGSSVAKSLLTEDGYTVEFKIDLTDSNIGDYKPTIGQEIGLAVRTTDGASALETFKGYGDHGPKSLSNVILAENEGAEVKTTWNITEVRELYDVEVDGTEDQVYADATAFGDIGDDGYSVKALWKEGKIYLYAELAEETESLAITVFDQTVTFNESGEQAVTASEIALEEVSYLTVKVNGETVIGDSDNVGLVTLKTNSNNFGRHLYEAKQLAEGASITVDGVLDAAYGAKVADVNTVFQNSPTATGEVYIRWDNDYLYVFVEVTDSSVCTEKHHNDTYHDDSVELSIDTCQTNGFNTPIDKGWGGDHRPNVGYDYEGEGHFRMNSYGEYSWQGWIWMGDDSQGVFGGVEAESREAAMESGYGYVNKDGKEWYLTGTAAKITATGYNVEYKMAWKSFSTEHATVEDKLGQVIGFMININDNNNHTGERNGVMSLNSKGGESWQWSGVLDQLKLVAAD